ncbi:hypothetical protein SPF06_19705 [Sinomonas sp. JGH33]|uniref:Uncharacterized protein n=1 Tax=Sinomonas terricola TaxID=3110330 RepID=A0ABU5TB90_9MICC|nr:hypothetical protein [Sinomonas sp. JGH33]MEA5456954.1 hypothetical protein [Sinomonas sp. JGH33]
MSVYVAPPRRSNTAWPGGHPSAAADREALSATVAGWFQETTEGEK